MCLIVRMQFTVKIRNLPDTGIIFRHLRTQEVGSFICYLNDYKKMRILSHGRSCLGLCPEKGDQVLEKWLNR